MASASGTQVPAIARLVAADKDTVREVIHRFNEIGLAAVGPSLGRITDADEAFIVAIASTIRSDGANRGRAT
jgi:hypothetical protein